MEELAYAMGQSPQDDFLVAAHTLLGAITILHEACSHTFRTKAFPSPSGLESQSPSAYNSYNNRPACENEIRWIDGISIGGESGWWLEDAGVRGALSCVIKQTQVRNL